jgi:hypothetical protein
VASRISYILPGSGGRLTHDGDDGTGADDCQKNFLPELLVAATIIATRRSGHISYSGNRPTIVCTAYVAAFVILIMYI